MGDEPMARQMLVAAALLLALGAARPAWADGGWCGDMDGEFDLGVDSATGDHGKPQDYAEAARYFLMAAIQGDPDAQAWLSRLYYNGWGVPQDYVQAYMWLSLSAPYGTPYPYASTDLDSIARVMTPSQIERARALAAGWKPAICQ
jgi:TPR repeat protein